MQSDIPINSNTLPLESEITPVIQSSNISTIPEKPKTFPYNLPELLDLGIDQNGKAFSINKDHGNPYAIPIGSRQLNNRIRQIAQSSNITLRRADLLDINSDLQSKAEISSKKTEVYYRIARCQNGIEIDLGDSCHTRIRVNEFGKKMMTEGSETLFYRSTSTLEMVRPAPEGKIELLKKHLNMSLPNQMLYIAWLTYTLAHPKKASSNYVILVLQGNQGSGKSSHCKNVLLRILDPTSTGVQMMPTNIKDLAVAVCNRHVVCFDNVRDIRPHMADAFCIVSTGGALTGRQLYSDAEQSVIQMHCAVVLNGIHSFVDQPDFAQRCLPIEFFTILEHKRKSEKILTQELEADLPAIMCGLYDLISDVFKYLPDVEVTNPERMIDYVHWLAAMELALNVPRGVYQAAFSDAVNQGQLDSLLDNTLASAVVDFAHRYGDWSDTPAKLLMELNRAADRHIQRDRDWPQNPIALSKRLKPLQASLATQNIYLTFTRGKNRTINITTNGI